jgi:hypothetical protein
MKAMLWVYSSAVYDDRFTSEVLFWGEDADDLDVGDASEAVSRQLEVDGSLPVEGEELRVGLEGFNGLDVAVYIVEIAHPTYVENGTLVCKTFIHAFTNPASFEKLKSAPGWISGM